MSQVPQTIRFHSLYLSIMSLIEVQKQMELDQSSYPFLVDGRILKVFFGGAPSQLGEQVVGRSPGESCSGADLACRQPQVQPQSSQKGQSQSNSKFPLITLYDNTYMMI